MINNPEHIENNPELNPDLMELISGSRIVWNKSSEEIWPELLGRIEGNVSSGKTGRAVQLPFYRYAAAAAVAVMLIASSYLFNFTKAIATSSAHAWIMLPDKSRVDVYPGSVVKYKPYVWKMNRSVKLQGEASFEVQKGLKFEVLSAKGKTIVQGTKFEVYARNNEYNVTCETGKVKVVEFSKQNEVIITGGQKALLQSDGRFMIEEISKTVPGETTSQAKSENHKVRPVIIPGPEMNRFEKNSDKKIQEDNHLRKFKEEPGNNNEQSEVHIENIEQHPDDQLTGAGQDNPQVNVATETSKENNNDVKSNSGSDAGQLQGGGTQARERFRSSLTQEQLRILQNQQMTNEEKRSAFMRSLSPEQNQMLREQTMERGGQGAESGAIQGDNETVKNQQKGNVRDEVNTNSTIENKGRQGSQNQGNGGSPRP
jgi:uncharacterized protein YlzI (FlbEa/FlbD family)